jgi:hypothetical protein
MPYLRKMQRMEAFTSSQRFTVLKNAWKQCIKAKASNLPRSTNLRANIFCLFLWFAPFFWPIFQSRHHLFANPFFVFVYLFLFLIPFLTITSVSVSDMTSAIPALLELKSKGCKFAVFVHGK